MKRLTLAGIQRFPHVLACKKAMAWIGKPVRIWSGEHRCWWRPLGHGYTTVAIEAGAYLFEEAYLHTKHCGPEKKISFELLDCEAINAARHS